MNLTREDVLKLADIAKLELSETQADALLGDLEKMLGFVGKVRALDLDGVEPLVYMTDRENVLRDDVPTEALSHTDALRNAPGADSDYFRVPRGGQE
ncbi:MAG: Asp-tRNA(Asn)/Glu-tRNA(Gln) amidotransferase subunit GatC [Schleiferiaceae bacterium]|jgi:aspartyl-tRNA(Asn)/glutamyl-tRNA(Gln) amidotransferase subunit C|nr:Asp-tRNA(Asn)/Glu-tRNA(Gln) amidotransferase subunit GatC [Schleiferiaceae bacterium]MDP5014492.1 Asp-tRNA(Asn)/Glu-tRNA(Gln) amidotransferase subunit GatC [Schleiferiaceae bacterium]